ncbi:MAG: CRISPR-associated protein Cas4 [Desulfurococcaceae archaeon]|jgi:CRISPR-associated exonuclease Cas4
MSTQYKHYNYVTRLIYEKVVNEQISRIEELKNPGIIYVTDLVFCTHKFHLKKNYPWLSISFEPSAILGSIAHWGLERVLAEKGLVAEFDVQTEVEVQGKKYLLKGRVDAIDVSNRVVIEVKTARSAVNLPKEHHVKQLNIYLNMLKYEKGILVYITPIKLVEYVIETSSLSLEDEIRDLIEDKYHPRYPWECKYCEFSKLCPYYQEAEEWEKR